MSITSPFPQITTPPQALAEVLVNEMGETLKHQAVYGKDQATTSGLVWGYYGGQWGDFSIVASTFTLMGSNTNYVVVNRTTGVATASTSATNWTNTADYARVYKLTTSSTSVTAEEDHRAGPHGVHGSSAHLGIPQNSKSTAYTTVLADAGKHIYHPASDANPRTFTIDSNANVAYPIGTAITFINRTSQSVTIAIASDTMTLAGTTSTGSRGLAQNGIATVVKVETTEWIISGTGLS
jgi:hypothetical protein